MSVISGATITIVNGYKDDGVEMALYVGDELITTAEIDGGNDAPCSLLAFLNEFGINPSTCGVVDIAELESENFTALEWERCMEMDESISEEQGNKLQAAGVVNEQWEYAYPKSLGILKRLMGNLTVNHFPV